ncbi:Transducin (beta)-like 3, partial [Sarracenia purpurea var. burkii]
KRSGSEEGDDVRATAASGGDGGGVDDRFEFDPNECSVTHGKWVFNASIKPLYSDKTCPYIDRQFSC